MAAAISEDRDTTRRRLLLASGVVVLSITALAAILASRGDDGFSAGDTRTVTLDFGPMCARGFIGDRWARFG